MSHTEIIEQLENTIGLIKQDGKDWLDDRDIPILEVCIKSLKEIDILKKDLKGRQKKIEKLISSDVRHACEAEHFKDLYLLECKKNCALFLRYKDVNKELALLKNSKEESEG